MFYGQVEVQLDEKNRIRIPSRYQKELGSNPFITCGPDKCLMIIPKEHANELLNNMLSGSNFATVEKTRPMRVLLANGFFAEEDKQGRITLPQSLLKYSGITKSIYFNGSNDRLEVWDKDTWDNYLASTDLNDCISYLSGKEE
ncbi:MAG: cell division/cell wall cluster transcriptional repressor MraZ [Clostridia bacterium]|nr:cell division/cell wall cluster transcriptional repressor MraZ [Clostridia bacterium]